MFPNLFLSVWSVSLFKKESHFSAAPWAPSLETEKCHVLNGKTRRPLPERSHILDLVFAQTQHWWGRLQRGGNHISDPERAELWIFKKTSNSTRSLTRRNSQSQFQTSQSVPQKLASVWGQILLRNNVNVAGGLCLLCTEVLKYHLPDSQNERISRTASVTPFTTTKNTNKQPQKTQYNTEPKWSRSIKTFKHK